MIARGVLALAALAMLAATGTPGYANRDGRAEAAAWVAAGKPTILQSHVFNTRGPGYRTPGLRNCDPRHAPAAMFAMIPELAQQEPIDLEKLNRPPLRAVQQFARSFNLEMFRLRGAAIRAACPQVVAE